MGPASLTASALLAAGIAHAQMTHDVMTTPQLAYEPNVLENVAEGDLVRVTFSQGIPHNIVSGSWGNPCVYDGATGINSGVHNEGEVFTFVVNSTDPQVYFCSVGSHCRAGMALAINPMGDDTVEAYQAAAESASSEGPESDGPQGGVLREAGDDDTMDDQDDTTSTMAGPMSTMSGTTSTMVGSTSMMAEPTSMMAEPTSTMAGSTSTMAEMSPAASETAQTTGAAAGLGSGTAMIGAIVAGGLAFAI